MISIFRLFRLGMRVARWAEPRIREWNQERQFQATEGRRHLEARNYGEAEKHLSLALAERRHSKNKRCELLLDLERAQRRQAKFPQAEQTLLAAREIASTRMLRSRAQDALLDLHLDQSHHQEAQQILIEILQSEQSESRPDRARLARSYRKLGTLLLTCGHKAEAMQAFRQAAELAERIYGAAHTETAQSLAELGAIMREQGDHTEAQRMLRRALEIHRAASGLDSPEATQGLYQLASSLEESGDLDGAAGEFERLLALRARQVGVNPLDNAEAQVRLAGLYLKARKIAAAKELLSHAIGVLERRGGQPLAHALELLACAEDQSGRPDEARRWREVASGLVSAG
jgi:tetratricopeptide (TPR) repeat protein